MKTKLLIMLLLLAIAGFNLHAQTKMYQVKQSNKGGAPAFIKFEDGSSITHNNFFEQMRTEFGSGTDDQWNLIRTTPDDLGFTHYKYEQMYKGIPVFGVQYILHEKNGKVSYANGDFHSNLNITTVPAITAQQAIQNAMEFLALKKYRWQDDAFENYLKQETNNPAATYYPDPVLVIAPEKGSYEKENFRLCWQMDVAADNLHQNWTVFIDAADGHLVNKLSNVTDGDVPGTARTQYNGTNPIACDSVSPNSYRLMENNSRGPALSQTINTLNLNQSTTLATAVDFTSASSDFTADSAGNAVHWGIEKSYDFFYSKFTKNSYNDNGASLTSYVHYSLNYNNAFWDKVNKVMVFGDGDGVKFKSVTALDVTGHELAHGFTQHTAGLLYQSESGALDESFSDIFGTAIEFYALGASGDWTLAEDIMVSAAYLRSMSDPKAATGSAPNIFGKQPNTYRKEFWADTTNLGNANDQGGVHTNSGVQNYWFYLLANGGTGKNDYGMAYGIAAIGIDKATSIAYRNVAYLLFPNANYQSAMVGSIQAAEDLYGVGSTEVQTVKEAWCAVGVTTFTTFQKTYGAAGMENAFSVQQTSDCGCIIAGASASFGGTGNDVYLVKTDLTGDVLWTKTYSGIDADNAFSVQQTFDGGYIVAGHNITIRSGIGDDDVYVIKTDKSGDLVWIKDIGTTIKEKGYGVQQTTDGGYIIVGHALSPGGGDHAYLIKTDAGGTITWTKIYSTGAGRVDLSYAVQQITDGGYIITGYTSPAGGPSDAFLIKTDPAGDIVWIKLFGGGGVDRSVSVQQTSDGGYIFAGSSNSFGPGDFDVYMVRTDPSGAEIWTKRCGGSADDFGSSVRQTSDGGFIVSGTTTSFGFSDTNVYVIKLNAAGELVWSEVYGGTAKDVGNSAVQATGTAGGYIIAGTTFSFGAGGSDVYLIKTDSLGSSGCNGAAVATVSNWCTGAPPPPPLIWTVTSGGTPISPATLGGSASTTVTTSLCECIGPAQPGTITVTGGSANVCPGDIRTYTVAPVPGAVTYIWSPPAGAIITSGAGTNSVTITYTNGFGASGTVKVVAVNSCGSSAPSTLGVLRNLPAKPGLISGPATACINTTHTYSVTAVAGHTYNWWAPTNATISSGQGTSTVTVDYSASFISGTLAVNAVNVCGTSLLSRTLKINSLPSTPGSISGPVTEVCPGTTKTYSVPLVTGITYAWTPPTNASIASGQGTNTVAVDFNASFSTGILSVSAVNACGSSAARTLSIKSLPSTPGTISGPSTEVCALTTKTYSVPLVSGVTYAWTPPINAFIGSGQGTNTVTVSFFATFLSGTLSVSAVNACGSSASRTLLIKSVAATPGIISGTSSGVCAATTHAYSVPFVSGVSWTWTPPTNASIASGQGTNTVTVDFNATFSSGTLSVSAVNVCGNSPARTLSIKSEPSTPGSISGPSSEVCAGTTKTYSVPFVSGVTWTWSPPASASIASGQGTNTVTVDFSATFLSGAISVAAVNACGSSVARTLSIKSVPSTPGTISGPSVAVCAGTTQTYSVPVVTGVTWTWTPPTNASIAGGQGTNTVTVDFNSSFISGTLSVEAVNSCGTSVLKSLLIKSKPPAPAAISGNASPCTGVTETYSISAVPGAVSYLWTVPAGSTITSGQGTTSVNVSIGSASGNITVKGVNACGNGSVRSLAIAVSGCGKIEGNAINSTAAINIYPNPTSGEITLEYAADNAENFNLQILDLSGRILLSKESSVYKGINLMKFDLSAFAKGAYILKFRSTMKNAESIIVVQ